MDEQNRITGQTDDLDDFDLEAFLNDPSYGASGYEDPGYDAAGNIPPEYEYQDYETVENNRPDYGSQGYDAQYGNQAPSGEQQPVKRRRRGPRITGVIFYLLLLGGIAFFYYRNQENLISLKEQLVTFENAQPVNISQQVFDQHFASPDWGALYDLAGIEDSTYEGKDAFVSYMTEKAGGRTLRYSQLPSEGETVLRYGLYLEEEQIGQFTMVNSSTSPQMPQWGLGEVSLWFTPEQYYRIHLQEGQTASVNGVALDDSFVIREDYIETLDQEPIRLSGTRDLEIRDLLVQPQITVADGDGNPAEVTYDETSRTYRTADTESSAISEEKKQLALDTVKTYCKYMINKAGGPEGLSKYFQRDTDTFKAITGSDLTWVQRESGHDFANEKVSDYVEYGENRFSVRVELTWQLTRPDGSVKESQVEESLIFEKKDSGWRCVRMTGKELTHAVSKFRITFRTEDQILDSVMVDGSAASVACPAVTAPEGKTFAGWMTQVDGENSTRYMQRILIPGEDGTAAFPTGWDLSPMELYPVFEPMA